MLDKLIDFEMPMPHGRFPKEALIQARNYIEFNPELAYDIVMATVEYALCGHTSYDDGQHKEVMAAISPWLDRLDCNLASYIDTCAASDETERLEDIARMYFQEHKSQITIAGEIGIKQGTVSKRIKKIREKRPELVEYYSALGRNIPK